MTHMQKTVKHSDPASMSDFIRINLESRLASIKNNNSSGNLHSFFMGIMEKQLISVVMERTGGNQSAAADILGINRNTLRKKIEEHNVKMGKKQRYNGQMHS